MVGLSETLRVLFEMEFGPAKCVRLPPCRRLVWCGLVVGLLAREQQNRVLTSILSSEGVALAREYCPGGTGQEVLAGIRRLCRHKPVIQQGLRGLQASAPKKCQMATWGFQFASLDPAAIQILSLSSTNLSHLPGGESLGSLVGGRAGKHQAWAESQL